MNKIISKHMAMDMVGDAITIMINGFMAVKSPETLIDGLVEKGVQNLTVIANDAAVPGKGIGSIASAIPYPIANGEIRDCPKGPRKAQTKTEYKRDF